MRVTTDRSAWTILDKNHSSKRLILLEQFVSSLKLTEPYFAETTQRTTKTVASFLKENVWGKP